MAENPTDLQLALNALSDYCNTWKLSINLDKTKIVRFSKGKLQSPAPVFRLNDGIVEVV